MEPKFIAYREKDREFLNEHDIYDLKDLIGEDLYLAKRTLDYNKITKVVKTSVSKKIKKPHIAIKILNAIRGFRKL